MTSITPKRKTIAAVLGAVIEWPFAGAFQGVERHLDSQTRAQMVQMPVHEKKPPGLNVLLHQRRESRLSAGLGAWKSGQVVFQDISNMGVGNMELKLKLGTGNLRVKSKENAGAGISIIVLSLFALADHISCCGNQRKYVAA